MNKSPPEPPTPASAEIETIDFGQGVVFRFCKIPAGTRGWVGSRKAEGWESYDDEEPARLVVLEHDLWLLRSPVTQSQYRAVMAGTGREVDPSDFKGDDRPVETLTWWDALRFCNAFSRKYDELSAPYQFDEDGDDQKLKQVTWDRRADGLRLPTEAEWELACRAGACTEYSAGDGDQTLRQVGWFDGNAGGETHPVGQPPSSGGPDAPAHPLGLRDLHGNVWEWCWDAWAPDAARQGAMQDEGKGRALRGGSWDCQAARCRTAIRSSRLPRFRFGNLGFRPCLVRSPAGIRRTQTGPASAQPAGPQAAGAGGAAPEIPTSCEEGVRRTFSP